MGELQRFALLFLLFVSVSASTDLRCYDCDPSQPSKCVDPVNDKITVCQKASKAASVLKKEISDIDKLDTEFKTDPGADPVFECFSIYYIDNVKPDKTGVYRGCVEKDQSKLSGCEAVIENLKNDGNITMCQSCTENHCNTHEVNGANSSIVISLTVIFLNFIIFSFLNF